MGQSNANWMMIIDVKTMMSSIEERMNDAIKRNVDIVKKYFVDMLLEISFSFYIL